MLPNKNPSFIINYGIPLNCGLIKCRFPENNGHGLKHLI